MGGRGGNFVKFGEIDETDKVSTFSGYALEVEVVQEGEFLLLLRERNGLVNTFIWVEEAVCDELVVCLVTSSVYLYRF